MFGYSLFAVRKGQSRPSVTLLQLASTELARVLASPTWVLSPDGIAGPRTDTVIRAIQSYYQLTADGEIGAKSWGAMTTTLGSWRPALRLRIAELENSFENGGTAECWGACNVVSFEGWPNFTIWNVNWPSRNIEGSSLGILLKLAGRTDLYAAARNKDNATLVSFFRSKEGREVQIGAYMNQYVLGPAVQWLASSGFPSFTALDVTHLPDTLPLLDERLLALSADIAVNSGPAGYAPKRVPRRWDGTGIFKWDEALPDRDLCRAVFGEVFGVKLPEDPAQDFDHSVPTRDTYLSALRRCLWEVCTCDEQRINLIADLQGRCIQPAHSLAAMVLARRRAVARKEGYSAQGNHINIGQNYGIGV